MYSVQPYEFAINEGETLMYTKSPAHDWWEEALWEVGQSSWASLLALHDAHTMERKPTLKAIL